MNTPGHPRLANGRPRVPNGHPRESGDPVNDTFNVCLRHGRWATRRAASINGSGYWVPAFGGMTGLCFGEVAAP